MRLGGFADEASNSLEGQIAATKELGWRLIELRSVDGVNVVDLPEGDFEELRARLSGEGIGVPCLGSTIANWGKSVEEPLEPVLRAAERAARRARLLGAPYVRVMSWAVVRDSAGRASADQREGERFSRLREVSRRFADEGITPLHENCLNYGGMSFEHGLRLLAEVPGLRMVYDTGNPGITPDFRRPFPYPNQDSWECYKALRPWIDHVHIKDGRRDPATGEESYFFPGEGECIVEKVVSDLLASGYAGDFSIEPHMAVVFHDESVQSSEEVRRATYLEYGRRTEALLRRLGAPLDPTR